MSAVLLIAEWVLIAVVADSLPRSSCISTSPGWDPSSVPGSGWSRRERFDPRTAKRNFGQIAGGGTFGGLLGGLLAERVAVMFGVGAMLPVLAILNLVCAWQVSRLVPAPDIVSTDPNEFSPELTPEPAWSGVACLPKRPTCAISRCSFCSARRARR